MKDSFVFYRSFFEAIKRIKNKDLKSDIFEAVCELALNENEVNIDDDIGNIIMDLIKPQIIANNERYTNGKKGGRPKKTIGYENKNHRLLNEKTIGYENKKPNVNVNDNENVNENDNDNIYTFIEKNFGRTLNSIEFELINQWEDNELTRYAIKQAVLNGVYNFKYINAILNNYKKNNIQTVKQAKEERNKFKNKKIPEWFEKQLENESEELTDDERREIEEIVNGTYK